MDINEIKKELKLIYYGYDENEKAFITRIDSNEAISEFTKILDKLEACKVSYDVVNMSYIKINS
jgi:hypothetical protein